VDGAIHILAEINGGSTSLPASKSAWKAKDGKIVIDDTVVVYSFIRYPDDFEERFDEIAAFIHEFGKSARQESVLIELSDGHRAYFVDESEYL
jgi:hypothetical protein